MRGRRRRWWRVRGNIGLSWSYLSVAKGVTEAKCGICCGIPRQQLFLLPLLLALLPQVVKNPAKRADRRRFLPRFFFDYVIM